MAQVIVTQMDGREQVFPTTRWFRRWEPTDYQLWQAARTDKGIKDDKDLPKIANVEAHDVLVLLSEEDPPDDEERKVLAVFKEWQCFRIS